MSDIEIGKVRDGGEILVDLQTREENPFIFKFDPRDIKEILSLLADINNKLEFSNLLSKVKHGISHWSSFCDYAAEMEERHNKYKQFLDKTFGEGYER